MKSTGFAASPRVDVARIAYVHIGTHKTGTTSIQAYLSANEARFAACGILLPRTGRIQPDFAAQPNVAWELTGDWTYDARYGTFAEMLEEIAGSGFPTVCISSEEFDQLHLHPDALTRFAAGFRSIGYEPRIIVYLRPQADYAESLYAEIVRAGYEVSFAQFLGAIVDKQRSSAPRFEYGEMLHDFAAIFGHQAITARAFEFQGAADALLRDFTSIVGAPAGGLDFAAFDLPARLNERQSFGDVFARIVDGERSAAIGGDAATGTFDPLTLRDIVRIVARFRRSNAQIEKLYGVRIVSISTARLLREIRTTIGFDRDARARKRWFEKARDCIPAGRVRLPEPAA